MKKKSNLKFFGLFMVLVVSVVLGAELINSAKDVHADGAAIKPATLLTVNDAVLRTTEEMNSAEAAIAAAGGVEQTVIPFRPTIDKSAYNALKATPSPVAPRGAAPGPLAAPALKAKNFDGPVPNGWQPPDPHGAVGKSHFVAVTNSMINVYKKGTTANIMSLSLNAFFGYPYPANPIIFDPRVIYDAAWNRYIVYAEAFPESATVQRIFIAISKTGNPAGAYWIYNVDINIFDNNDFWDYGQLGMDQDAIFWTANIFIGDVHVDTRMFAVAKARLYNGLGWSVPLFTGLCGTLAPPIVQDQNRYAYFVGACDGSTLTVYRGDNLSNAYAASLVWQANIDVPDYGIPSPAAQPAPGGPLDTLDGRFENASAQYGDSLWNIHSIGWAGTGTAAAPKFYEIDIEGAGANTIKQQGMFWAGGHDWNASITANTLGEVFVTWNSTFASGNNQAEIRFSGRQAGDPVGVIPPGITLFQSSTYYTWGDRWGDYSSVSLDPQTYGACAANRRAWLINEYIAPDGGWATRIARLGFC